jgi:hypothetical protein
MNKILLVGLAAILAATGNARADDHKGNKAQNSDAPPPPSIAQNSGRPQGGGAAPRYVNQLPRNGYSNLPNVRPYAGNVRLEGGRMVYGSANGRLPQVDNWFLPGQNNNGIPRRSWRHFEQLHGDTSVTLQNPAGRRNQDKQDNSTEPNRGSNGRGNRGDSNNNTAIANNWRNRGGNRVVPFDNANTVSFSDAWRRCHDFGRDRHDRDWWHRRCNTIILIGGGFWAWDAGWWYPAWGYDPYYSNYAYNGPIYGYDGLPPDQVIANVQSALQELGYFPYEVDGVLGPTTQDAIANYQNDNGLYTSGAIDRPTLVSLGFIY